MPEISIASFFFKEKEAVLNKIMYSKNDKDMAAMIISLDLIDIKIPSFITNQK